MRERFDTIVVAVDFSETSEEAWRAACALATALGSHLHLVHASPDPMHQAWTVEAIGVDFKAVAEAWRLEAGRKLETVKPEPPIPADRITRAVETGVPHRVIVEYATRHDADLIVMGTHGYGQVKHLLLGSVAERVVREAPCPVVTVPHRERRDAMREAAADAAREPVGVRA